MNEQIDCNLKVISDLKDRIGIVESRNKTLLDTICYWGNDYLIEFEDVDRSWIDVTKRRPELDDTILRITKPEVADHAELVSSIELCNKLKKKLAKKNKKIDKLLLSLALERQKAKAKDNEPKIMDN